MSGLKRTITIFTLIVLLSQTVVSVVRAAGPTVDHRFYIELPNGAKKKLEMKGVKIHKSVIFRKSNGDIENGKFLLDQCRYPDEGNLQRPITGGYHCATNESCYNEDIGAPYLPPSFNAARKFNSLSDTSYMNFYNETFTSMLTREAPYLVQLYDPTNIRGFTGAKWVGNVDWAANNGGMEILQSGTENPHPNEPVVSSSENRSWSQVYGYSAPQSWGPGEVYRNPQGGNILQGRISWSLIPPQDPPPRSGTAQFQGTCFNKSCPAVVEYKLQVVNIEPVDVTSTFTKSEFFLTFWGNWNASQKAAVKAFLGTPDFEANGDFGYKIGETNNLNMYQGKPFLEYKWAGSNTIGKAANGKTLIDLVVWTQQRKTAGQPVPTYGVSANLTIDGGKSTNGFVGATNFSLLQDECSSCVQVQACTPINFTLISQKQGLANDGSPVDSSRSNLQAISADQDNSFYSMGFGGTFTIKLNSPITDKPGNDISFKEVTLVDRSVYIEKARVEVSQDGSNYMSLGEAINLSEVQFLDLAALNGALPEVNYIRLTDTTNKSLHSYDPRSDGYDIDAIGACSSGASSDKPTATMDGAIIACSDTLPNLHTVNIKNIDLKGNGFKELSFRLSFVYSAETAKVITLLGEPDYSTWATQGRARQNGDVFEYVLKKSTSGVTNGETVTLNWNDSITFGKNNQTISQFTEYMLAQNISTLVTVVGNLQTTSASGGVLENPRVGAVLLQLARPCPACPVSEQGPPNDPIILLPSNLDTSLPVINNQVTVKWTQTTYLNGKGNVVDQYEVLLYPTDPTKYPTPDAASAAATGNAAAGKLPDPLVLRHWQTADKTNYATEYTKLFTLPANIGDSVTIAIRSINNAPVGCAGQANSQGPWTIRPDLTLRGSFGGRFFKSESCNLASATPVDLTPTSFVTITRDDNGQQNTANAVGSSYAIEVPATKADYFAKLKLEQSGLPEALVCSSCNPDTGDGFCSLPRTQGPTDTADFFLESYNLSFVESWWQTRSGLVYGHNGVASTLPLESGNKNSDCLALGDYCEPFLIRRDLSGEEKTAGIPMTKESFSNIGGWWNDRTDHPRTDNGSDNKSKIVQENYNYFASKIELPTPDITKNISSLGDIPPGTELKEARLSYSAGSLRVEPDVTWVVGSGEKRVIFVNGDLTISQRSDQPVIKVEEGGFLAFIVSGSITFDSTVGHENVDETTPNQSIEPMVEGVFIANGTIRVASRGSDDKKFVAAGTYVGWSGVHLGRTFDNGGLGVFRNTTTPSETFIYRPDFLTNSPELIKFSELVWQEVN